MTEAVFFMLVLGGACGAILSIASKVFYVYEDPRISIVENLTAGANCGGCGYAGCASAAEAVVKGEALPSVCIVAGAEAATAIAEVVGLDPGTAEPLLSVNTCNGGDRAEDKYAYMGIVSCRAMSSLYGGKRVCGVGCLGLGDCVKACAFDAIYLGKDGYPVVDENKCVGCGACRDVCPKNILSVKTMSQRLLDFNTYDGAHAPCAQTCPAQIDIPKYIGQIRDGDYEGAVHTIRERNPLLLACGRVCPHPCEDQCRRGVEEDAVSINQLKRFVADYEMNSGKRLPISCAPDTGKKIAVIGGGPAGITCAYFLRRLGHGVTVFDMMPKLGGMIRYGIPEYRLPKEVLEWEIDGILNLGIEAHTNVRFGRDFDLASLVGAGFDAIFLGVGAWKDYNLRIEGADLKGVFTGIDFLTKFAVYQQEDNKPPVAIGKKCVVIGGGNTAIDCVRTLVRLGADEVSIVYRRTKKEMPANMVEIEAAEHEGIKFNFLASPNRVVGDENGNAIGLEYLQMELGEPDESGRRRPVPVEGSETIIDIDMLVLAIGQGPDISFKESEAGSRLSELETTKWDTIDSANPETLQTNIPYIFTGGDSATGASLVVEGIGGGRRAARSIHQYVSGEPVEPVPNSLFQKHIPGTLFDSVDGITKTKRAEMPELPVAERIKTFEEADLVLQKEEAMKEANRCLSCCRICYTV